MAAKTKIQQAPADLEDLQAEMPDLIEQAESLISSLRCAESCETIGDFAANLDEALERLGSLRASVREVLEGSS